MKKCALLIFAVSICSFAFSQKNLLNENYWAGEYVVRGEVTADTYNQRNLRKHSFDIYPDFVYKAIHSK